MNNKKTQFINLNNARLKEQKAVMEVIKKDGACPFCLENLQRYHKQVILQEGQFWLLTTNQWPYKHTKAHYLLIYKKHAVRLADLEAAAGAELFSILQILEREAQLPGGALALRFGDTDYSAGTVNHLHAQLIVPDISKPDFEPVRLKIGLQLKKRN